jgi:uncharacterized protein (TIGR00369 family)
MKAINPEYVEKVNQLVNSCPYFDLLAMKISKVGAGFSEVEIDLAQKHLQPFGFVHGGVYASIIDAAAFWAVFYDIDDPDTGVTTVDLTVNYLAPTASGKLIAKGRQIKMGKTLGYADAEVTDASGRLLAHGTSTVILLPGQGLKGQSPLPPKFV